MPTFLGQPARPLCVKAEHNSMNQTPPLSNATKRAAMVLPTATDAPIFRKEKHISYWLRCLRSPLPQPYTSSDANRMTLAFFTVSALDLLGVLFTRTTKAERDEYIAWIYRCQHPDGGFRAFTGADMAEYRSSASAVWDPANVPATYFALSSLCVLQDDLQRVDRRSCLSWLRRMQRPDGSFGQTLGENGDVLGGMDTRFGYCAMVIRWILRGGQEGVVEGVPDIDVATLAQCIRGSEVGTLAKGSYLVWAKRNANMKARLTMVGWRMNRFTRRTVRRTTSVLH